jgi:hypothetical protein
MAPPIKKIFVYNTFFSKFKSGSDQYPGFMTLFEFRLLSYPEQIELLYEEGIYIGKRKENGQTLILIQLSSFYIEISYSLYRVKIEGMTCTELTAILDPYLEQVEIELLV